jgi:hypothetical protein
MKQDKESNSNEKEVTNVPDINQVVIVTYWKLLFKTQSTLKYTDNITEKNKQTVLIIKLPARPIKKPKKLILNQLIKQKNNINIIIKKKFLEYFIKIKKTYKFFL